MGSVFIPGTIKEQKPLLFSDEESEKLRGGAAGHVVAIADYSPSAEFTYYFGSAWSKDGMNDMAQWANYLDDFSKKINSPLKVKCTYKSESASRVSK